MKYSLILILLFFIGNTYGQVIHKKYYKADTIYTSQPLFIPVQYDSSKIYWKKAVYWEDKMNKELDRLNKSGHANDISKSLVRFQDSAIRYKILLDRLKK